MKYMHIYNIYTNVAYRFDLYPYMHTYHCIHFELVNGKFRETFHKITPLMHMCMSYAIS